MGAHFVGDPACALGGRAFEAQVSRRCERAGGKEDPKRDALNGTTSTRTAEKRPIGVVEVGGLAMGQS